MNHEAPQTVQRSNFYLGVDRYNAHGLEARNMPYPYLWCGQAKTAYLNAQWGIFLIAFLYSYAWLRGLYNHWWRGEG